MPIRASGTFNVSLNRLAPDDPSDEIVLARMSIDKQFQGDLNATSKGQMLAAGTDVKGSAGYVAIERVTGMLQGRAGTFILQHNGVMNRGEPTLSVTVVPDSATGELVGLAGTMVIIVKDKAHFYEFEYTLPES